MRYFYNLSSSSEAWPPDHHRGSVPGPRWETFVPKSLICPPLEKIPRTAINKIKINDNTRRMQTSAKANPVQIQIRTTPLSEDTSLVKFAWRFDQ